ncbi:MAG: hypothetical protein P8049_02095 [Gemmatimonadota bacterium]
MKTKVGVAVRTRSCTKGEVDPSDAIPPKVETPCANRARPTAQLRATSMKFSRSTVVCSVPSELASPDRVDGLQDSIPY